MGFDLQRIQLVDGRTFVATGYGGGRCIDDGPFLEFILPNLCLDEQITSLSLSFSLPRAYLSRQPVPMLSMSLPTTWAGAI